MSEAPVVFEQHGAIATIRLNRPDRLNAIDAEAGRLMLDACRSASCASTGSPRSARSSARRRPIARGRDHDSPPSGVVPMPE